MHALTESFSTYIHYRLLHSEIIKVFPRNLIDEQTKFKYTVTIGDNIFGCLFNLTPYLPFFASFTKKLKPIIMEVIDISLLSQTFSPRNYRKCQ